MDHNCKDEIDIGQIEMDTKYIDYDTLSVIHHILMNNLEQMGRGCFLGTYYTKLDSLLKYWSPAASRYLIALLEYLNPLFSYNGKIMVGKLIVVDETAFEQIMSGDAELLSGLMTNTPIAFQKYGMLLDMRSESS